MFRANIISQNLKKNKSQYYIKVCRFGSRFNVGQRGSDDVSIKVKIHYETAKENHHNMWKRKYSNIWIWQYGNTWISKYVNMQIGTRLVHV